MARSISWLFVVAVTLFACLPDATAESAVDSVRFGTFDGRTRIVVDLAGSDTEVSVRADPESGTLQLLFPEIPANIDDIRRGAFAGIVEDIVFGATSGNHLAIELRTGRTFRIGRQFTLPRNGDLPVRFVVDLDDIGPITRAQAKREQGDLTGEDDETPAVARATPTPDVPEDSNSLAAEETDTQGPEAVIDEEAESPGPLPDAQQPLMPKRKPVRTALNAEAPEPDTSVDVTSPTEDGPQANGQSACGINNPLVVIDPGHGGKDPGAQSRTGLFEKTINLRMALLLRDILDSDPCLDVALTRDSDKKLRLRERVQFARQNGGDVFLSVHADSIGDPSFGGMSAYTFSDKASDEETERLVQAENASDGEAVQNFTDYEEDTREFLFDMLFHDSIQRANQIVDIALEELGRVGPLVPRPKRSAGFAVLTAPDIPSFLLELGYLSNPNEVKRLENRDNLRVYAEALRSALRRSMEAGFLFDADAQ